MIIFDLDGTLADCENRRHFVTSGKHDWKSFYEACDQDRPIKTAIDILNYIYVQQINYNLAERPYIEIWSGRCESVRGKTTGWMYRHGVPPNLILKMRPIGDSTPDDVLKEIWLDEAIHQGKTVEFVFDDRPKAIRMWRRRGIFVFNCCQHDEEF